MQQLIDFSLATIEELDAKWLTEMAEFIANDPSKMVNGFIQEGIIEALYTKLDDGSETDEQGEEYSSDDIEIDESS